MRDKFLPMLSRDFGRFTVRLLSSIVFYFLIYSSGAEKEIPRAQRRGAIIVLGMIAAARRHIVTNRIDEIIRIGFGKRGKADLVLAKYSCIALQRLSGTVKKVKGIHIN